MTKAQLAPYVSIIQQRKARNPDSPLWASINARWSALLDQCRSVIDASSNGKPMNRNERQACHEIIKIGEHVDSEEVINTALALYLMQEQAPYRFASDDAFRFQLVRRLRGLADVNAGMWFDHETGKAKRVYRDLPARTISVMGAMFPETFGIAGLLLARREEQDREKKRREVEAMAQAVRELE